MFHIVMFHSIVHIVMFHSKTTTKKKKYKSLNFILPNKNVHIK